MQIEEIVMITDNQPEDIVHFCEIL